jgi:HSP20 family protein
MNNTQFDWIREIQDVSNRLKDYFENIEKSRPQEAPRQPQQPPQPSYPTQSALASDVYGTGANIVVEIEIPGARKEELKIEFSNGTLEVSGERKADRPADARLHRQERSFGAFRKQISFPKDIELDVERISASYQDGILRITLPKRGAIDGKISVTIE